MRLLLRAASLAMVALALVACGGGNTMTGSPERGRLVYTEGRSPSGDELTVSMKLLGEAESRQSALRYACANCHGPDGLPRVEGGVNIPSIQPHALSAPSLGDNGTGRKRVAYDREKLLRAVTMGIDSSGNPLNVLMPRFNLSERDAADLLAWMDTLGSAAVPGVGEKSIRVAVPSSEHPVHRAVLETVQAFARETNQRGGIYGRSIEVAEVPSNELTAARLADAFCLVAPMGSVPPTVPKEMPVFGTIVEEALFDPPAEPNGFQLLPAQASQLRVAVDHHCGTLAKGATTFHLVLEDLGDQDRWQRVLGQQLARFPGSRLECVLAGSVGNLPADAAVLLAGSAAHKSAMLRALAGSRCGNVYATHRFEPGTLEQLPQDFLDRLKLLLPIPVPAVDDPRLATFRDFLARQQLAETHVPQRIMALAASLAFGECIRRCGTRVTRERVLEEAQKLDQFRPSLFPPISWTLNRRIGAIGAQVVRFDGRDRSMVPEAEWREPQ